MITLISVSRATLLRAQSEILGCEDCSEEADRPFTWTLDSRHRTGPDSCGLHPERTGKVSQMPGGGV